MSPAAEVITALLKEHAGVDLRLRAWDGSEAGPPGAPVVVLRSPQALQRILWRPGELGLARAYVSGDLDVEGDLTDGLRRVRATAPRPGPFGLVSAEQVRVWRLYLAGGALAFEQGRMGVDQILARRPPR